LYFQKAQPFAFMFYQYLTVDNNSTGKVETDDDAEAMMYEFDKIFPEITKYAEAYEAEIAKLIENLDMNIETVLVEYRDI
jgi:hypothetical protein